MSNSTEPGVRVGVDMFSGLSESSSGRTLCLSRSAESWMSASWEMVFGLGELGVRRWLEKPADPSVVHAQEPKMRVVPSDTLLASLDPAIEFDDELTDSPTWRVSCRCLLPSLLRDTLSSRIVGRDQLLWNSMVQGTQRFRQVRTASCVIPYVLCGCLYCLRC